MENKGEVISWSLPWTLIFDIKFSLIPPGDLEINGLDRQTDRQTGSIK